MGCDIHAVFQAKTAAGKWREVVSEYKESRHYFLFSWLAGVRNGHGFAGVRTYSPVEPISMPRGLPRGFVVDDDEKWLGDHSHSWLTADEILSAAIPSGTWRTGIVDRAFFDTWDGQSAPSGFFGGISGRDVVVAESPVDVTSETTHVRIFWKMTTDELAYFIDEVRRLKHEHGDVRMVFGFDMTERELYLRAAKIIDERGLAIGCYRDKEGRICMWRALMDSGAELMRWDSPGALAPRLFELIGPSIFDFSDSLPHKRDAIAALLIAADLAA